MARIGELAALLALVGCGGSAATSERLVPSGVVVEALARADLGHVASERTADECTWAHDMWSHRPIFLHHDPIAAFVEVSRGKAALRVEVGHEPPAVLAVEIDGWQVSGVVDLDELAVYASKPLWLASAIHPYPRTALHLRVQGGELGAVSALSVRPHEVVPAATAELLVHEHHVSCGSIGLAPAEYGLPSRIDGIRLAERPTWNVRDGAILSVGPRKGQSLAELVLRDSVEASELSRRGDRCWVGVTSHDAWLLGWLDCQALFRATATSWLGPSHQHLPPPVAPESELMATFRCAEEVSLEARRGKLGASVGRILPDTFLRVLDQRGDEYRLAPPGPIRPGQGVRFVVTGSAAAKARCAIVP